MYRDICIQPIEEEEGRYVYEKKGRATESVNPSLPT